MQTADSVSALVAAYNEHEKRRAAYAGRDLTHEERLDLALSGLAQAVRGRGGSIADFLAAGEVCDARLRQGQKVGTAIRAAVAKLRRIEKAAAIRAAFDSMPAAAPAVAEEA
ncbi:MAG: hypothetical protein ACOC0M_00650 [Halomonas sp.]